MTLDQFEIFIKAAPTTIAESNRLFPQVELRVNGVGLIDLVRLIELPFAEREFDERVANGEPVEELFPRGKLAGNYIYSLAPMYFLPCLNLLGEPFDHGFSTKPDDPRNYKSILLECTCGIPECWFLIANIRASRQYVKWSDFQQFHRKWTYELGPFVFDRAAYEAQLSKWRRP